MKAKPKTITTDEFIECLNAECRKIQRRGECNNECFYIGWCEAAYRGFWVTRDGEPVELVSGDGER